MSARVIAFALAVLPAFAQQMTITGLIQTLAGNEIRLLAPSGPATIYTDDKTVIWRSNESHAALHADENVRVLYVRASSGRLVAREIQTRAEFSGMVSGAQISAAFDLIAGDTGASRHIFLSPHTDFGTGAREFHDGARVLVIGWDLGYGRIEASRIAVYDIDTPVSNVRK